MSQPIQVASKASIVTRGFSYLPLERQVARLYLLVPAVNGFMILQCLLPEMDDHAEILLFSLLPLFGQGYLED